MTKKEYILHILESLKDDWELARWLTIIIINSEEESKILDLVFNILKESLKNYSNKKYKDRNKPSHYPKKRGLKLVLFFI